MTSRTVDVIAGGPPSPDPYDHAAPAWALAAALAERGDSVAVVHPNTPAVGPPPNGVADVPVEVPVRRPGAAVEGADFASAAGKRVRRTADLVLRDPAGFGRLGLHRGNGGAVLGVFVREMELASFDRQRGAHVPAGLIDRIDSWRDRRAVRRLEEAALREADRLFYDAPGLPADLRREYAIPERRFRAALPPVAPLPEAPAREAARAAFRIPSDVPVVATLAPVEAPEPAGVDRVREAFRRVRSFFPGSRLVVAGAPAPVEPGVAVAESRDGPTFARAIAAADVVVLPRRVPGFDPGAILALRAGRCVIAGPAVHFPVDPAAAVRAVASDDAGELASVLAELLADPAARRALAAAGESYAAAFDPLRIADEVRAATTPGAG